MSLNFIDMISLFAIYAFVGWCSEVIYATMNTGKFVNRGFLNGPLCPIYGFGVVIVVLVLDPLKSNLLLLFLGSILLTSALELATGAILERFFLKKWWDYSDEPYNIKGYICLKFSILWGLACVFVIKIIQPGVMSFIHWIPTPVHFVILILFYITFFTDLIITVTSLLKLKKQLLLLKQLDNSLDQISEAIGTKLSEGTVKWMNEYNDFCLRFDVEYAGMVQEQKERIIEGYEKVQEQKERLHDSYERLHEKTEEFTDTYDEKLSLQKQKFAEAQKKIIHEFEQLKERYETSLHKRSLVQSRIRHAFPKLKLPAFNEMLDHLEELRKKD